MIPGQYFGLLKNIPVNFMTCPQLNQTCALSHPCWCPSPVSTIQFSVSCSFFSPFYIWSFFILSFLDFFPVLSLVLVLLHLHSSVVVVHGLVIPKHARDDEKRHCQTFICRRRVRRKETSVRPATSVVPKVQYHPVRTLPCRNRQTSNSSAFGAWDQTARKTKSAKRKAATRRKAACPFSPDRPGLESWSCAKTAASS